METFIELLPDLIVALFVGFGAAFQFLNWKRSGKLTGETKQTNELLDRVAKKVAPSKKKVVHQFIKTTDNELIDVTDRLVSQEVEEDE